MKVKYIEFDYPGAFFPESSTKPYDGGKVVWPEYSYAYRIGEREEVGYEGSCEDEVLKGDMKWGKRHIRGKKMSRCDVEMNVSDNRILLSNMRCNNYEYVIKCPGGNFQPLLKDDIFEVME